MQKLNILKNTNALNIRKKFFKYTSISYILCILTNLTCFAEDASGAVNQIHSLGNFLLDIIAAIGLIVVVFGVIKFATAFMTHDGTQKVESLTFIGAGLILAAPRLVLLVIGVSV